METILRVAIQKSGRLSEDSVQLMIECGLEFESARGNSRLKSRARNFPIEFLFLRDDDIPGYVADGVADLGIIGENNIRETDKVVNAVEQLGFSRCRLSIAVPKASAFQAAADLKGKKIATSHPRILGNFLKDNKIDATIHEISGSVEIAPSIGLADAVCDLVGSGSTLASNGLREVQTVLESQAVLIATPNLAGEKAALLDKLLFRIKAVRRATHNKYVVFNAPNSALEALVKILPGMKSPTVVPLKEAGWSSVHSVVDEDEFWVKIESLREAGAQGILVMAIEKMIL